MAQNPDRGFFSLLVPSCCGNGGTGSLVSAGLVAFADLRLLRLLFLLLVKMLRFEPRRVFSGFSDSASGGEGTLDGC